MYLGIDLGGTNIAAGLVGDDCKIVRKLSTPTLAERSFEEIIKDMAGLCSRLLEENGTDISEVKALGIGTPGAVDNKNGTVLYAGNLGWHNANIREEMGKYFSIPINIENDANAAAYGEYVACGTDIDDFIFITLGTGVGGGIIINKQIYRGFNGAGAELGHCTLVHDGIRCNCGKAGCWEVYASVSALINQTAEAIKQNPGSLMAKSFGESGKIDGRTAFDAAKAGDEAAQSVVKKYLEYVADGICSMVNIFEPEMLMIGGGISKEGDYLLAPIVEYCEKNFFCKNIRQTKLGIAGLGNDAGIVGAALAARQQI